MPSEQHRKAAILSGMRILVIDDSANARRLLKSLLMAFGVGGDEVIMVGDAPSGLELLHTIEPDLIICDWNMQPMDGIQFLRTLRLRDTPGACTPTIMLTAHTNPELVKAAMEAGANHFVAKPVVPANLLKRIQWVRADKRVYLLEGDHYVLKDPGGIAPPPPNGPSRRARPGQGGTIWEV
ncbi:response regulator [Pyruvatibacter mobilis]|jgi:CheY-like chemotaxis protein|uniref:Response regulator n=1 Tax=Pyruvatibacter mobilis TaxID=1712261 RepID=A0A845QAY1_9HYPH|nr:response regulator [Pyruvatibacter mobilis]NBG95549.1 response regulator [Pyruvatibacter mobilis]QJD75373.1 response regulator [Pyruvatibacter mobilis]